MWKRGDDRAKMCGYGEPDLDGASREGSDAGGGGGGDEGPAHCVAEGMGPDGIEGPPWPPRARDLHPTRHRVPIRLHLSTAAAARLPASAPQPCSQNTADGPTGTVQPFD